VSDGTYKPEIAGLQAEGSSDCDSGVAVLSPEMTRPGGWSGPRMRAFPVAAITGDKRPPTDEEILASKRANAIGSDIEYTLQTT
jgi:hypothetical protein